MKWSSTRLRPVCGDASSVAICATAPPPIDTRERTNTARFNPVRNVSASLCRWRPRRSTRCAVSILLAATIVATGSKVRAQESETARITAPHLRTTDNDLRAVLADGIATSPTLHALVKFLEQSDVVVYLERATRPLFGVAGRLTFVSAQGGRRYVVVHLACVGSRVQQLAILAHELQHAVEIAADQSIVDEPSMMRAYARIGYVNRWVTSAVAFDTKAAREIEERVRREVSRRTDHKQLARAKRSGDENAR